MMKESYERMEMLVTEFGSEDVIATSGETGPSNPSVNTPPLFQADRYEKPNRTIPSGF